jgi:hypothetical protein
VIPLLPGGSGREEGKREVNEINENEIDKRDRSDRECELECAR